MAEWPKYDPPTIEPDEDLGNPADMVGQVISGRYRIKETIASGGIGNVYVGQHVHMRKRVAIKILNAAADRLPHVKARFEREAMAGAHIEHPNVAAATDFGRLPDGSYFLVMEYVDGRTLREAMTDRVFNAQRALRIGREIALGLHAAHSVGIVHRDLKPANIMIVRGTEDQVKLIDFGFAKLDFAQLPETADARLSALPQAVTGIGQAFGTPPYMAPEAAEGMDEVGPRADLHALGVILFELLARVRPIDDPDLVRLLQRKMVEDAPPLSDFVEPDSVPPEFERLIMQLLARDKFERPSTGKEVADRLEAIEAACYGSAIYPRSLSPGPMSTDDCGNAATMRWVPSERPPGGFAQPPPPAFEPTSLPASSQPSPSPVAQPSPSPVAQPLPPADSPASAEAVATVALASRRPSARHEDELRPAAPPSRHRVTWSWALAVAGLAIGFGFGGWYSLRHRKSSLSPMNPGATPSAVDIASSAALQSPPSESVLAASASAPIPATSPSASAAAQPGEVEGARSVFWRSVARKDWKKGALALSALVERDPHCFEESGFVRAASSVTASVDLIDRGLADQVFELLAQRAGPGGVDVLYDIVVTRGAARGPGKRALLLLQRGDVRQRATPATRVAVDLHIGSCPERRSMYERAVADGDDRALTELQWLLSYPCDKRGKSPCCFRADKALQDAIMRLRAKLKKG